MDLATIIGFLVTFGLIIGAILSDGSINAFLNVPSMLIVIGGTFGVGLVSYPLKRFLSAIKVAINVFRFEAPDPIERNRDLLLLADMARREGLLALESQTTTIDDPFLRQSLELLIDGVEPDRIQALMENDVFATDQRHRQGAQIFDTLSSSAPAMGLIGTLVGLVQMLQSMDDPSSIGPAMAVALLTTFYGAILSTAIFGPMAQKLRERNTEELLVKELTIKGVMGIAQRDNPRLLAQVLEADLPPRDRTP